MYTCARQESQCALYESRCEKGPDLKGANQFSPNSAPENGKDHAWPMG